MYISRRLQFRTQYDKQKLIAKLLFFLTGTVIISFIFSFAVFAWYAKDLPSPSKLSQQTGYSTVFLDRQDNSQNQINFLDADGVGRLYCL